MRILPQTVVRYCTVSLTEATQSTWKLWSAICSWDFFSSSSSPVHMDLVGTIMTLGILAARDGKSSHKQQQNQSQSQHQQQKHQQVNNFLIQSLNISLIQKSIELNHGNYSERTQREIPLKWKYNIDISDSVAHAYKNDWKSHHSKSPILF